MTKRRGLLRPRLEILEDRTVPATYRLIGGTLFISNQTAALTITSTGGNSVTAQDGAGPLLAFSGLGGVNVMGTNLANKITFDTTTTFNGNLFVNTGNGADKLTVEGGSILGNITVLTGRGDDVVRIHTDGGTVGGNVLFSDTNGDDLFVVAGNVLGNTTILGANTARIGGSVDGVGVDYNFGGNVTITNLGDGFGMVVKIESGGAGVFGNNLNVTGSSAADAVRFLTPDTVGGNTNINLGQGDNTVLVDAAAVFEGGFTSSGGGGVDKFTVNDAAAFNGNVTLNMGDGDNLYNLNNAAFTAAGNFTINAGNGDNKLGKFGGDVAGDLNVNLGNGTNNFKLGDGATGSVAGNLNFTLGNGDNTLGDDGTATIGGVLRIRSGSGNNVYTAKGTGTYNLDIRFGNGDDTFQYKGAGAVLTGLLDGGNQLTADTFTQGAATLSPNLTIANFP